ncbi:hypothetical protein [Mesorhizobium sp.]|uniref:hypothetical protein n=1 Tax=Mesorhizobium sp. TaxID=1871066 RepID=UPI000FE9AA42|nr:hypothetical protein [Mesorhizobium sp.]RWM45559.1 MAG: hypothetical protein EOR76_21260 [Mesorhizobium sp.]RWM58118.1 MAG: hypothetical protein EOR79_13920 [Mesorhizobium sp.]RWM58715.1 MAG: hypothetical protein EOR78_06355 [Mesorhizobium sp.]TIO65295.1 MAG: hypothetical protein E5X85_29415 [Mesorhizobium sp.]TIR13952.1 MAG: hypothetical protein E5X64_23630 [Mesorhizobium sp.]
MKRDEPPRRSSNLAKPRAEKAKLEASQATDNIEAFGETAGRFHKPLERKVASDAATDRPHPIEILRRIARAVEDFLTEEADLLEVGINERSLTHKLAVHLQPLFTEWHVDCEYNRRGTHVKSLSRPLPEAPDDTEAFTIFPDIIVHRHTASWSATRSQS